MLVDCSCSDLLTCGIPPQTLVITVLVVAPSMPEGQRMCAGGTSGKGAGMLLEQLVQTEAGGSSGGASTAAERPRVEIRSFGRKADSRFTASMRGTCKMSTLPVLPSCFCC